MEYIFGMYYIGFSGLSLPLGCFLQASEHIESCKKHGHPQSAGLAKTNIVHPENGITFIEKP